MSNAFAIWATRRIEIDKFVDALAARGYPDCNDEDIQREVAEEVCIRDFDDFIDGLTSEELDYLHDELRRKIE